MSLEDVLSSLLEDYRDLQPAIATVLDEPPSSLEALRLMHAAHPAVIAGCGQSILSAEKARNWDLAETYLDILGHGQVSIAITDDGFADSVRHLPDGTSVFVKPLEESMAVSTFLTQLRDEGDGEIMYLQSQDGNVYRSHPRGGGDELAGMRRYVRRDIDWMKEAVGASAEAVNLWIGSSKSVTSLHHDPYENIYHVLSGTKTFTLLSPIEGLWLDQHFHPPATLHRSTSPSGRLEIVPDSPPAYPIPWVESAAFPDNVRPIVVKLNPGDTLYLPSGWWHRVEQSPGPDGLAVAINYWYNSTVQPAGDALFRMAQRVARLAGMTGVIPVDPDPGSESEASSDGRGYAVRGEGGVPASVWTEGDDSGSGEEWEPSAWGR